MSASIENTSTPSIDFQKLRTIASLSLDVIPVVIQDAATMEVLTLAYTNEHAFNETIRTGHVTLWSTSRNALWIKGATSGDRLKLCEIRVNCEQNSLLYLVKKLGQGACHTQTSAGVSRATCFYRTLVNGTYRFISE